MIKIIETKKKKKKNEPYYLLKFEYMIGDANGNTSETVKISKDNPYLERFYTLLTSLKPIKNRWGVILEWDRLLDTYEEGQLTEEEYSFLEGLMFDDSDSEAFDFGNDKFSCEFFEGVRGHTEYSYLTLEGLSLKYVDEYGIKHKCEVV